MAKIDQNEAIKLYAEGWTKTDIAKRYGVSLPAVTKFLGKRGIDGPETAQRITQELENERKKVNQKVNLKARKKRKVNPKVNLKVNQVNREEVTDDLGGLDLFRELEETYKIAQAILKEARNPRKKDEKIALEAIGKIARVLEAYINLVEKHSEFYISKKTLDLVLDLVRRRDPALAQEIADDLRNIALNYPRPVQSVSSAEG